MKVMMFSNESFYSRLQPRTEVLLKALVAKGVDNKQTLLKAWQADPTCKNQLLL